MNYEDLYNTPVVLETYFPRKKIGFMKYMEAYTTIEYGYVVERLNESSIAIKDHSAIKHFSKNNIDKIRRATREEELMMI